MTERRPPLEEGLSAGRFLSYYYLKEELAAFCRKVGLSVSGGKQALTARIAAFLEGKDLPCAEEPRRRAQPAGELTPDTAIEEGVVFSEKHRAFFREQIGPSFSFLVPFQKWLKQNAGKTYGEAVEAYRRIRSEGGEKKLAIDAQFEYNAYIRAFFAENGGRTLRQAIACWNYKKGLPGPNRYDAGDLIALSKEEEMETIDFKKKYPEFYLPKGAPSLVDVPAMRFVAVRGQGDPNEQGGAYQAAVGVLYAVSYTIKMSRLGGKAIEGYFPYVVPPLEGLWWMRDGSSGVNYADKSGFRWVAMIRLPDFVTEEVFAWALAEAAAKKGVDTSAAELFPFTEGRCAQCMHVGSYDDEPATLAKIHAYLAENGLRPDLSDTRRHHEIYLSDPRRTAPEKRKTVLRIPVTEL